MGKVVRWLVLLLGCVPNVTHVDPTVDTDPASTDTFIRDTAHPRDTDTAVSDTDTDVPLQPCEVRETVFDGDPTQPVYRLGFTLDACVPQEGSEWDAQLAYFFLDKNGRPICGGVSRGTYLFGYPCPTCDTGAAISWHDHLMVPCEDYGLPPLVAYPVTFWGINSSQVWYSDPGIPWEPWQGDVSITPALDGYLHVLAY